MVSIGGHVKPYRCPTITIWFIKIVDLRYNLHFFESKKDSVADGNFSDIPKCEPMYYGEASSSWLFLQKKKDG